MQENNADNNNISSEETKKNHKNNKKEKSSGSFISETKSEFKKITWPTRRVLINHTITVIVISLIVGAIIYGYDFMINFAIEKLISL